jgi:signal transduction histidine kinase
MKIPKIENRNPTPGLKNVKPWENPALLFVAMGLITMAMMILTYVVAEKYQEPIIAIIATAIVAGITFSLGGMAVKTIEKITSTNKMKSDFISIASHQLRTPLTATKWSVGQLLEDLQGKVTDSEQNHLEIIQQANERMGRIVKDLLDANKIDGGRIALRFAAVNPREITDKLLKEYSAEISKKGLTVSVDSLPGLPSVEADPSWLEIIIDNFLTNAIKYTLDNKTITIKIFAKNENLIYSIVDEGVGIPESDKKKIFVKFFRANNVLKQKTIGTGLGLYITKSAVESHMGKVWFNSTENQGSTFSFSIPLKQGEKKGKKRSFSSKTSKSFETNPLISR